MPTSLPVPCVDKPELTHNGRPLHLVADIFSGLPCCGRGHQSMRRLMLVGTHPRTPETEPRSTVPANSGEGPSLFWSPELAPARLRRVPSWHPRGTVSGH